MTAAPYTIFVNSCDSFEDCWHPFFHLLRKYWQGELPPLLLNTEHKTATHPGLQIQSSCVQRGIEKRMTWSECLDACLAKVQTPLVLYLQEDYFIERPVDQARIEACAQMMLHDPTIRHIGLTHFGAGRPLYPTSNPEMLAIGRRATYRISTQAALWRTEALRSYLLPWENGWMFELFGTLRSWRRKELLLTIERTHNPPPIYYQHTGIIKGKWSKFIPPLFASENIDMDFSKRGFYEPPTGVWRQKLPLLKCIVSHPLLAAKSIIHH